MEINTIGVPIFYGCDIEGVNLGPNKLRENGLLQILSEGNNSVYDLGNLHVPTVSVEEKFKCHESMKYLSAIIDTNRNLAHAVYSSLSSNSFPLVIGGDHSLGLGSISGASKYFNDDLGVVWVDAHGDINTHLTTPSGNVHGMPLAAAMGIGHCDLVHLYFEGHKVKPEKVFILCARDLDQGELDLITELKINVWTTNRIKEMGIETFIEDFLSKIHNANVNNLHLSFDIDSLDSSYVPGTGTPVSEGLNLEEIKKILSSIFETTKVKSMDVVEFNPALDKDSITLDSVLEVIKYISKLIH